MATIEPIKVNRTRTCNCCLKGKVRKRLPAPTPNDKDYNVSVCRECDQIDHTKIKGSY